jgi:hypothetical protein
MSNDDFTIELIEIEELEKKIAPSGSAVVTEA